MRYDLVCLLSHAEAVLWRWVESYDRKHDITPDCTDNMLCECQRRNCPGKTVSTKTYVKGIMNS